MNTKKFISKYFIFLLVVVIICLILPVWFLVLPAKAETNNSAASVILANNEVPPPPPPSNANPATKEVIAPALQYLREDYPAAFLSKDDYSIKLNTQRKYKLRCSKTISAVAIGDVENIKAEENDEADEERMLYELAAPKDIIIKTRQKTYTYMQIFTDSNKPVTVMMSVNAKNNVPGLITFGECTMFEDIN